jgi:hypothetical protein
MENELLTHEALFLRAQLKQARRRKETEAGANGDHDGRLTRSQARLAEEREKRKTIGKQLKQNRRKLRKAESALKDVTWLLTRLDRSPAGPLLRRKAGFRTLTERYGIR